MSADLRIAQTLNGSYWLVRALATREPGESLAPQPGATSQSFLSLKIIKKLNN